VKRSFLKRSLLLSAASMAFLPLPALAVNPLLTISNGTTSSVKTSTAVSNAPGDITIDTNGSITVSQTGPGLTLDSSNNVQILGGAAASISNKNHDGAQGILIDTGTNTTPATITGSLVMLGGSTTTIDLTGSGTGKTGIGITGNGTFTGNITTSAITVQGDSSSGIGMSNTATLVGNLLISGNITMTPTTANETNTTGITAVSLAGTITGNVSVAAGTTLLSYGNASQGVFTTANISGSFANFGTIMTEGFQSSQNQSTGVVTLPKGSGDPLGGTAVAIGGSIAGGFLNAGPDGTATAVSAATITMDGGLGLSAPIVLVSPSLQGSATPTKLEIGVYTADSSATPGFSFYNRGTIATPQFGQAGAAGTIDPNVSIAGVVFSGISTTANVQLDGLGILNSGVIGVQGRTTSSGTSPISAIALSIGAIASNGGYVNAGDVANANSGLTNSGLISASISGALGGTATAIGIGNTSRLNSLTNSGTISATATTTNPSAVQTEAAYAINDQSGTLSKITNSGTIQAGTTQLTTPGFQSVQIAAYLGKNTTGVTFVNTGAVTGDVIFGQGADTLSVSGTSASSLSTLVGNLDFGSAVSGVDTLNVNAFGFVSGQIRETTTGMLNVNVAGLGTLNVQNNSAAYGSLLVNNLTVADHGTLNIAVSTVLPGNVSVNAGTTGAVTLADGANLNVIYSSFIPASGQFVLLQAANGNMNISNTEFTQIKGTVDSAIPFLFGSNGGLQRVTTPTLDQLVLSLAPKTASQLGLTGYAAQVFPYANAALENDDALGAGMIGGITSNATAQTAYSQFAPDASGGTRAIAISLTDHATGPVAARQRALRLYATQPGDLTLWGQEFAQQISDKGSDGLPGFKDSGFGFALGADGGDALGGWYGGAFTFYTGNVDQRAPSSSRNNTQWYMLSGYSTWRGKGLFLDTQLTAGYGDLSEHRFITVGNPATNTLVSRQANSKRSSALAALGMTTGANLVYGSTTITPNIALDGLTMREEGYTETGGGTTNGDGFDLHVNPVVMGSLRGFVGVNARQDVNFGSFYMQPELRVGYRYDFLADRIDLTASFPSVTGTGPGTGEFTITGPQPTKGNVLAGASVSATTGAWSIGLNYDMLSGSNGSMTQVGTVSLVGRI